MSQDEDFHIRAAAGAGKTFVALNHLVKMLEENKRCLYVARNPSLCFSVVKWLEKRLRSFRPLSRLTLLYEPLERPRAIKISKGRIVTELAAEDLAFDLVVVDEAHHVYRDATLRARVEKRFRAGARRLILSDLSQSDGREIPYPPMRETELTEVVRSSKRVVAGAMQFQLGGEAKLLTQCHHDSTGPPLKSFLFDVVGDDADRYGKYADETLKALDAVVEDFPGLSLHDRVAIILPDAQFAKELKPRLDPLLLAKHRGRFELVGPSAHRYDAPGIWDEQYF